MISVDVKYTVQRSMFRIHPYSPYLHIYSTPEYNLILLRSYYVSLRLACVHPQSRQNNPKHLKQYEAGLVKP